MLAFTCLREVLIKYERPLNTDEKVGMFYDRGTAEGRHWQHRGSTEKSFKLLLEPEK